MNSPPSQPIVIFGGFLTYPMLYQSMRRALEAVSGCPVSIIPTHSLDWLSSVSFSGVALLLDKLHRTIRQAAAGSSSGKITLVGHSAGGVFSRLYLSPEPFAGRRYAGLIRATSRSAGRATCGGMDWSPSSQPCWTGRGRSSWMMSVTSASSASRGTAALKPSFSGGINCFTTETLRSQS